jgi:RNA polymerase-binding transcription factor DksA
VAKAVVKKMVAKAPVKKTASKPAVKKVTSKPAVKKPVAKAVSKKLVAKAPVKKPASKPASKKPVAKAVAKKIVAKVVSKKVSAKPVSKKAAPKPAAKKPILKPAAKKAVVKAAPKKLAPKSAVKKVVPAKVAPAKPVKRIAKKPAAKLTPGKVVKITAPIVNAKPSSKKPVIKPTQEDKVAKMVLRRKKIQEIKNNYETPTESQEDNYDNYKLPIIGRTRFSDAELNEFRTIINRKLAEAREELNFYQDQMKESEMNDDDIKFSGMEDGGHTNDKEHLSAMANRQVKFIQNLEGALIRIENKTYGICRMTGNLIDKKRLAAVPHATLSIEAKIGVKKR